MPKPKHKRVTWASTTIHEFELGHNPCSIPSTGGPPIGLVGKAVSSTKGDVLDRLAVPRPHKELLLTPMRRIELLRDGGHSVDEIAVFVISSNQCRTERHETEQEYAAIMRQRYYEAYLAKQQIMAMEMERQRQLYLSMQYQMQLQMQMQVSASSTAKYFRGRQPPASSDQDCLPASYSTAHVTVPDVQVLDAKPKRRRLSVEAILN
ncbi:Aste57867_17074 [Aphanomyces stellatus]|uniref:Aste57867_17074 protein n=1 Tax=Aphanomyces stellatus TaxID=120398 RepID=A0A485L6Y3_9STRA|nr:hypothetical protein As57867_017016 [Aphanomyces stellatus]VFT93835.1 Aste57867_17074 [Aphanomyces stellatus]